MRKTGTRMLSLLLALIMTISLLSVAAFAEEPDADPSAQPAAAVAATEEDAPALENADSSQPEPAADTADPEEPTAEEPDVPPETEEPQMEAITDYSVFITDLETLERYAAAYAREHDGEDPVALVINFIRTGVDKYNSGTWNTFCGAEKTAFTSYVADQDALNGTQASALRALGGFTLPNGDDVEFAHMFGCMDMSYHTGNRDTADLGSWAGDICDLVQLSTNAGVSGTVEEMVTAISTTPTLFLYDDPTAHSFGQRDLYADLDAYYILSRLNGNNTISQIMRNYYTANLDNGFRAMYFLENRLGGAKTKSDIRNLVFEIYLANEGIRTLEGTYVADVVNPDLRKACCYVFADYLFENAKNRLDNAYFTQFSVEKSTLAPGVTQEIKLATTADNKQLAYYVATADISRSDVHVYANYGDNDATVWKMARVSDQVAAAQAKHSNPDDPDNYIENYNAVASVNADFYNMSTGQVSGTLAMEGVIYGEAPQNSNYFFAILKDGTPVIDSNRKWSQYRDNVQEAVGGGALLVQDGKIKITSTSNYYNDRASRTCVGITYDGQVVLMVLDGRQEPWSCGGSAIEIAQIMLDAGCVSAVNLDGGGSTTYVSKPEGSNQAVVTNRPSDGYERSVSSSLLVVSTAKPSNVFDHAVVSADYDYLTPGTTMAVYAAGVTATGGPIDLPEGSELRVSDAGVGELSDGVFTAKALGDVQLQVVSAEGTVLGSKTIHVVVPTDLKFTRDTLNVVYGVPAELPIEASYNGNVVKINPDDVTFGYLKVSLQSIGNVEGGDVNTTVNSLVFDYPEAGTISGFEFTGNEEGGLRTLTIGAVLTSKLSEFEEIVSQAATEAYQQARANGFTHEEAQLIAQDAGVTKGLESASKLKLYLYSEDEATFDFNNATGGDGLLNWKREVSNSNYKEDLNTYFAISPDEPMVTSYTFAVDMSKMPIPEKLTGLLYMLPGGDQEGRTAWQFLLQLAERISCLTTVTVSINIPDGFEADVSELKLVNEYFDLTSVSVDGNVITIVANFKTQTEPINPTSANPLCVLSGLKLTPTDEAAWDEDGNLDVHITGSLTYDIYAHFHVLMTLGKQEKYRNEYGLYDYDNRANDPNDYGAHFSSDSDKPIEFTDDYRLSDVIKEGWVREDGAWLYYVNGTALTGPQYLPNYDETEGGTYWFNLGEDGASKGKYTGFAQQNGVWYYPVNGTPITGWFEIGGEYYCFRDDGSAYTGSVTMNPVTYDFAENGRVLHGVWHQMSKGMRYYYGPDYYRAKRSSSILLTDIDGATYGFDPFGYRYEGVAYARESNGLRKFYQFDENGIYQGLCNGLIHYEGKVYFCEDGDNIQKGLVEENGDYYYIDNTRASVSGVYNVKGKWTNGLLPEGQYTFGEDYKLIFYNGLIEQDGGLYYYVDGRRTVGGLVQDENGDYYYIDGSCKAVTGTRYINKAYTNGLKPAGTYVFGDDYKMVIKSGIVEEDGKLVYYVESVPTQANLFRYTDNALYFAGAKGVLAVDTTMTLTEAQTNGLKPAGVYEFGSDGKLIEKNGIRVENGRIAYYVDGQRITTPGMILVDGDYYYIDGSGWCVTDTRYVNKAYTNGLKPGGTYSFGPDGKMVIKNGIVEENGKRIYYVESVPTQANLFRYTDGALYFADAKGVLVVNASKKLTEAQTNGLKPAGVYDFDADGKLIEKTGIFNENGRIAYYVEGQRITTPGMILVDGDYYYIDGSGWCVTDTRYINKAYTNGLKPAGTYSFGPDGKMILKNGVYEENGKLYRYVDGEKYTTAGMFEFEGDFYYIDGSGCCVTDTRYITKAYTNGLKPAGTYTFGPDGKMILKTGIFEENGKLYYYVNGDKVTTPGMFEYEGDLYYIDGSGVVVTDTRYINAAYTNGLKPAGTYTFGPDGKMLP